MDPRPAQEGGTSAAVLHRQLGDQYLAGRADGELDVALDAYRRGVDVAHRHGLSLGWIVDACADLVEGGMWEGLTAQADAESAGAFQRGVVGIVLRRQGDLHASQQALDEALRDDTVRGGARRFLQLHRAHAVRNSGRYREAEGTYRALAEDLDRVGVAARIQMADLDMLRGDFAAALAGVDGDFPSATSNLEARRLAGHVFRFNGRWSQSVDAYRKVLNRSREVGTLAFEGKALTNLAETYCWYRPGDAVAAARQAVATNTEIGNHIELVKAHAALAAALAVTGEKTAAEAASRQGQEWVQATNYQAGRLFVLMADAYLALASGDEQAAREARSQAADLSAELDAYPYVPTIIGWWLGDQPDPSDRTIGWLDPADEVRSRWREALDLVQS